MPRTRLAVAVAAASLATVIPLGSRAAAQQLENQTYHDEFHFVASDFCGVAGMSVQFDVVVDGRFHGQLRGSGQFPLYQDNQKGKATLTNLGNGKSYLTIWNTLAKDMSVVDNGDGTATLVAKQAGNFSFYDSSGHSVGVDAGAILEQYRIDFNGTPSDPFDDVVEHVAQLKLVGHNDSDPNDTCPLALSLLR